MKNFQILLFLIVHFLNFGQAKNCHSVNVQGKRCNIQLIKESNDTIYGVVGDDCYITNFDLSKTATWIIYTQDTSHIREIISYCNGLQSNRHVEYYQNGKLKTQCNYENSELTGPYLTFYETGTIRCAGSIIKSHFIGTKFTYWDNGAVAEVEISTENSRYRQFVNYYDPSGNSLNETEFKQMWGCD